jgi:hypothetical protein
VAFSPDGQRLASGGGDTENTIRIWDARSGQELLALKGHTSWVRSVAFSPDGQRLASASTDKTIRIWDAHSGQELLAFRGYTRGMCSVAFSPDGQRLASGGLDTPTIRIWDARRGPELLALKGHTEQVRSVAFSPDGQRLASASDGTTIRIWDTRSGQALLALQGHTDGVTSVAFSPDGQRVISQYRGGKVLAWDTVNGNLLPQATETIPPNSQAVSSGRRLLAHPAVSSDRRLFAHPQGNVILLIALSPQDADELAYRLRMTQLDIDWHDAEVERCEKDGSWFAAVFHLNQLLSVQPDRRNLLARRATVLAAAAARDPKDAAALAAHSRTALADGKTDDYRKAAASLAAFVDGKDAGLTLSAARTALLGPDALGDFKPLLEANEKLAAGGNDPAILVALGGLLLRSGRADDAVLRLEEARKDRDDTPLEDLLLALAYHRLQKPGEARRCLARAVTSLDRPRAATQISHAVLSGAAGPWTQLPLLHLRHADPRERTLGWQGWLELQILWREAETMLKPG